MRVDKLDELSSLLIMSFPIVEKLGGWSAVELALQKRGVTISEYARLKWPQRGQLPRDIAIALSVEACAQNISFSEDDFKFLREPAA